MTTHKPVLIIVFFLSGMIVSGQVNSRYTGPDKTLYGIGFNDNFLPEMRVLYNEGQLHRIADIGNYLLDSLKTPSYRLKSLRLSKSDKIELYEILSETFIVLHNFEQADKSYQRILRINAAYQPRRNNAELIYWNRYFRTRAIYSVEFGAGLNFSKVEVMERFGVENTLISDETYTPLPGLSVHFNFSVPVSKWLELSTGIAYSTRAYAYKSNQVLDNQNALNTVFLEFTESQAWLNIPVRIRIITRAKKPGLKPYVFAGADYHLLTSARFVDMRRQSGNLASESPRFNLLKTPSDLRVRSNYSATGGIGFQYPAKLNRVFIEGGYALMFNNMVKVQNRYSVTSLLVELGYVDNDFRMGSGYFTAGYILSIYKPKLKKKYKLQNRTFPE